MRINNFVIIDPCNVMVTGLIDLTGIIDREQYPDKEDVLDRIAYNGKDDRLFEIELIPLEPVMR